MQRAEVGGLRLESSPELEKKTRRRHGKARKKLETHRGELGKLSGLSIAFRKQMRRSGRLEKSES